MHAARIAGLEKRLRNLARKLDEGWPESWIAPDQARTLAELTALRGIEARNAAAVREAPAEAVRATKQATRAHIFKEEMQKTPGGRRLTQRLREV